MARQLPYFCREPWAAARIAALAFAQTPARLGFRNPLANVSSAIDLKGVLDAKFCCYQRTTMFEFGLVLIETLDVAIVSFPAHPFRFGWQFPFFRVKIGNQFGFDFRFATVRAIVGIEKL